MASEDQQKIYEEVIKKGCCKRCALRYLGFCKTLITFDDPDTCLANFGLIEETVEPEAKVRKDNPCAVCLGLLQDNALNKMLDHENILFLEKYEHHTFVPYITFPTSILIRDHSMKLYLAEIFPESFSVDKVIQIKHAWRFSIEEQLSRKLMKIYNHHSKLTLHFYASYILENDEIEVVQMWVRENLSKRVVDSLIESISEKEWRQIVKVPPSVPLYEITVENLLYFSEPIHLVGNYCKYSRQLPLTESIYSHSVSSEQTIESIIATAAKTVLGDFQDIVFDASSFDDKNDRVLGPGRTFHLQLTNAKFENVSRDDCEKIQRHIRKSRVMEVKNLRETDRRESVQLMELEKMATKRLRVLCKVYGCKNLDRCINAVNMYPEIVVQQKTPVRVLAGKPMRTRKRKILYIKASKVEDKSNDLIELELCAEHGLYIPEFVYGDFGRTKPNLCEIIKAGVECLAIDVIELFPTLRNFTDMFNVDDESVIK